jgi:Na+-translocating ferredoxin:NAD+ oxidoreductase RnfG subunit
MVHFLKKHIISISLFLLTAIGGTVWAWIQKGAEAEFKENVQTVINEAIQSKDFMDKVMKSEYMKEYKIIEQRKMVTVMLNSNDSNRVKFSAKLSAKTGLTVEALIDSLANRVHEKNLSEREVIELIRRYNRTIAHF